MAQRREQARGLVLAVGLMLLPALALADDRPKGQQPIGGSGQQAQQGVKPPLMDVEELNDSIAQYAGQRVSVAGEIEDKLGPRSFVLESGGIFNDEIVTIIPQDARGLQAQRLNEDDKLVITGTVRSIPVVELEREYGWDLNPELEAELEGVQYYLVADSISRQRD